MTIQDHLHREELPERGCLTVLVVDDNDSDRQILQTLIRKQGHRVITASDGVEALKLFREESPGIVLLDALMPRMDGFEAARHIKKLSGESLVPIIFLTSLRDPASLADCLAAGGDDFLSKPYNKVILQAKIEAFARMQRLHELVQLQRDEIAGHNDRLLQEQLAARPIFDNIAHPGCIDAPNIRTLLSPMAVFNGDLVLVARNPSGGMYVFLGDFTGHGLPAAVGAMPISEIFYGMSHKGFSMQDILIELNNKLHNILPLDMFCCACMLELSFRKRTAEFWIGGLPDILIYRHNSGQLDTLTSTCLALGILDAEKFNAETVLVNIEENDRIFAWSDGIIEATNDAGEMFGQDRIRLVFEQSISGEAVFDDIIGAVRQFTGKQEQRDDCTMVEVTMVPEELLGEYFYQQGDRPVMGGPLDWSMTYELRPQAIREFNPLPLINHVILEVPGLCRHSGKLYTVISELYSNALEHGLLGLDSELKTPPDGFTWYYAERAARLLDLETGIIRFYLNHKPKQGGGSLTIGIEDSGDGFDFKAVSNRENNARAYCGRGIALIEAICSSVLYQGKGNRVEALFEWEVES